MKQLFLFEWKKVIKAKTTKICFVVLLVVIFGMLFAEYDDIKAYQENDAYRTEVNDWKSREEAVVKFATESLNEDTWMNDFERDQVERRIAIAQYRLDQNIPKDIYKNIWWFFNDKSFDYMTTFLLVLVIFMASVCFAGEYHNNTLRQVLLLPYKRVKILTAKLLAVGLCGIAFYAVLIFLGFISGLFFHGIEGINSQVVLYYGDQITLMHMGVYSMYVILLKLIDFVFYLVFALLIAILTKSTAVSALIVGATSVLSIPLTNFIGRYYPVLYYLPSNNLNFRRFMDYGTVMPQIEASWSAVVIAGITVQKAIFIVLLFVIGCIYLSYRYFNKQEM